MATHWQEKSTGKVPRVQDRSRLAPQEKVSEKQTPVELVAGQGHVNPKVQQVRSWSKRCQGDCTVQKVRSTAGH